MKLAFSIKITLYLTKNENRTKKSLTKLSYYFFEFRYYFFRKMLTFDEKILTSVKLR